MSKFCILAIVTWLCYFHSSTQSPIGSRLCSLCICASRDTLDCSWTALVKAADYSVSGEFKRLMICDVPVDFRVSKITEAVCRFLSYFHAVAAAGSLDCAAFRAALRHRCPKVCTELVVIA